MMSKNKSVRKLFKVIAKALLRLCLVVLERERASFNQRFDFRQIIGRVDF
jgi:hypothetical protein